MLGGALSPRPPHVQMRLRHLSGLSMASQHLASPVPTMTALYNDNEPFAAEWCRILIENGMLAPGEVSTLSVKDACNLNFDDYVQAHFFAGIGTWSYALRLADWPDRFPVWTGSCPCQPFSMARQDKTKDPNDDPRHLWPDWRNIIESQKPPAIFGEQSASSDGRTWLGTVQADLEALGYTTAAADLCAAGIGSPHARQRLFFGAIHQGSQGEKLAHGIRQRLEKRPESDVEFGFVRDERSAPGTNGLVRGPWRKVRWVQCTDGAARPVGTGIRVLVDGTANRVPLIRALGNAIVPQVAATFIRAFMKSL